MIHRALNIVLTAALAAFLGHPATALPLVPGLPSGGDSLVTLANVGSGYSPYAPQVSAHRQSKVKKTVVSYDGREKPGTIIIDTAERRLYYVLQGGKAIRYGIGVGRPGFQWSGVHRVSRKAEWPGWTPPPAMRQREPHLPHYMPGGPNNPLGARALYLGSSIYRIHGSNAPWTIGNAVSSGCIRMTNDDVRELYEKVGIGTKVIVRRSTQQ